MNTVSEFTLCGSSGVNVRDSDFLEWLETHNSSELGEKIVAYSWYVNGVFHKTEIDIGKFYWRKLPDSTGFICFESKSEPNNCVLLDAYGKERMRLTVPWQMTGAQIPEGVTFGNIDGPYTNPIDSKMGMFGVTGWVGESKFYFELDYHTGVFLWCKRIRD